MQRLRTVPFFLAASLVATISFAQTVTDPMGREVTLEQAPTRIISMAPGHTSLVLELGAGHLLVAVDEWSVLPEGLDVASAGNAFSPNVELLVGLEPDLVLADAYSGLQSVLAEFGIPVYAGFPENLAGVATVTADLGVLLHQQAEADALLANMNSAIDAARAATEGQPLVSVYVEADSMLYASGSESWLGELIAVAGGEVITNGTFPQLNAEFILAADPDVIILLNSTWGESADTLAARPGWSELSALQNGRVIEPDAMQVDFLSQTGVHAGVVLDMLTGWLHPGLSAD